MCECLAPVQAAPVHAGEDVRLPGTGTRHWFASKKMYECLAPVHGHQYTLRKIYECLALVHAEEDVRMPGTCTRRDVRMPGTCTPRGRCTNAWHRYTLRNMYECRCTSAWHLYTLRCTNAWHRYTFRGAAPWLFVGTKKPPGLPGGS